MQNNNPLRSAAEVRSRRKFLNRRTALGAAVAALFAAPLAHAQVMRVEPAIGADVTYSSNGNQAPSGQEQADVAVEVRPEFWITYQTARLKAYGLLGAVATTYIGGERSGNVYPMINIGATLQAIRDVFYVDADVVASRQFANPFAPRSTSGDANAYASYAYRVAPYFQGELPSWRLRYLLRNDFYWTRTGGEVGDQFDDGYEWRIRGELATSGERRLGLTVQYERDYLKFPDEPRFVVEVGRAIASYQVTPDFSVHARGGYEWEEFPASEGQGAIYGAGFSWRPTPRTDFSAWWEERFFGGSWLADLSHRTPWFAVSLSSSRLLSYGTQSLFDVPRTNNVFRSLDAILSSRVPDPIERSRAVRDLLTLTGLPFALATPVPIYSQRVDLQQANTVSIGFLGARNSLVADAYHVAREGITAEGEPLPGPFRLFTDETQRGASVTFSHRLARSDSVNATQLWQRTEGSTLFDSAAESTQWTTRVQYNRQLEPRTTAYAGARYIKYESNVFSDFNETAAFVGLYHRFY
ncbi:MAG TPA: TIGR03016 family PEP-CTERM system-associated outer membrane protein [Burkholderiaceae bacterium]|nr:TIGR03016 family PEP-CTERM system-associated outer membrane protein [Burkholderiaceae bacterium]